MRKEMIFVKLRTWNIPMEQDIRSSITYTSLHCYYNLSLITTLKPSASVVWAIVSRLVLSDMPWTKLANAYTAVLSGPYSWPLWSLLDIYLG